MTKSDVQALMDSGSFPYDQNEPSTLVESSISFIILKGNYAYKIKKVMQLSFLDFSTIEKRLLYCEEEVRLNKRLAHDMYLNVLPISKVGNAWSIGNGSKNAVDYAVLMKRMNPDMQLDVLLEKGIIKPSRIKQLGKQIADFHASEKTLTLEYDPYFLSNEFADIQHFKYIASSTLGESYSILIDQAIELSNMFVECNEAFIRQRAIEGHFRACHGDLHAKNIFLYKIPVVFDCIEFKKEFREIDVLNEVAFLCMDLETSGYKDLSKDFLHSYLKRSNYSLGEQERQLFKYFKAYRACIRAKVALIALSQEPMNDVLQKEAKKYLPAMIRYLLKSL